MFWCFCAHINIVNFVFGHGTLARDPAFVACLMAAGPGVYMIGLSDGEQPMVPPAGPGVYMIGLSDGEKPMVPPAGLGVYMIGQY